MSAAIAIPQAATPSRKPLAFLALLGLVLAAILYGTHAVERHGTDAELVRRCVENGGTLETWTNPQTWRQADICRLPDGRFGIMISRFEREVTSFAKDKLRRLEQVRQYLANRGYIPAQ